MSFGRWQEELRIRKTESVEKVSMPIIAGCVDAYALRK